MPRPIGTRVGWMAFVGLAVCSCADQGEPPAPASTAARPTASAGGAPAPTGSGSSGAPVGSVEARTPPAPLSAPRVWEAAYAAVRGAEPVRPEVQEPVPPMWPECATFEARELLRAKHSAAHSALTVEINNRNTAKRADADREWLPKQQAWLAASNELARGLKAGQFPAAQGALQLEKYGAVGALSKVVKVGDDPAPTAVAFRAELAKSDAWTKPFECTLLGAVRTLFPLDDKTREAVRASGGVATNTVVDQLACELDGDSPRIAVVVEVPVQAPRAKVTLSGAQATVTSYEVRASPGLDAELAQALGRADGESLAGRTIRVTGVSKLHRAESGPLGYALLSERGMEKRLAIRTAEYKKVWIASFQRACADEGLGCTLDDGRPAPEVKLVQRAPEPKPAPKPEPTSETKPEPTPEPKPEPERYGRWEAAAHDGEPSIDGNGSYHENPWGTPFFPSVLEKGMFVDGFGAVGQPVKQAPWPAEAHPMLVGFREGLAKRGGMDTFVCTVKDLGQEVGGVPSPLRNAALRAKGVTSTEAANWVIVCDGDEKSHRGTVVVYVPTDAVWAVLDGTTVKDYHYEAHGYFHPELRDKLLDVGVGTKLEISGVPRLARSIQKYVFLRAAYSTPAWRAYLGDFQCAHEGLGCVHQDGRKPQVKVAPGGLVPCPVSTWEFPPKKP